MILDIALVALLLMSLALGHFLGVWRHLGVVAAMGVGYVLTPLWVPHAVPQLTGYTTWPPMFSAVACVAVGILLPGLVAAFALQNVGRPPEEASALSLVLEGFAGSLSWGLGAVVLSAGLLGAFSLHEPDALVTTDRLALPLRTSRAYEEVSRFGLLHPDPSALAAPGPAATPPPAKVKIDVAAMKRDPRLRAALADPVVRRAMETGDSSELEQRNRALRPLAPPKPAGKDKADPDFIDPRELR